MNRYCYIGIDPAFRERGFCVCIIDEQNTIDFKMFLSFLDFLDWVFEAPTNAFICVENSNLQDTTFLMAGSKAKVAKLSRDVGKNQAASQYTFDTCVKIWGSRAFEVSPKQKGKKWNQSTFIRECDANKHKLLKRRNNQDERDAYKLALWAKKLSKKVKL